MKTIIHVNRNIIQKNAKDGTSNPVCKVQRGTKVSYGMKVKILGPSQMIYSPEKPLKCGAKLWIETETEAEVELE